MRPLARRTVVAGMAAGVASIGGCVGVLTGSEPLAFESAPARVGESALSGTGYELAEQRTPTVTREFDVAGQTREVEVTNALSLYEKSIDLGPLGSTRAGVFALFTTPAIEIAGRTLNPVEDMSTRELLGQFQSRYEGLTIGQRVGRTTLTTLGTRVGVEKYGGRATIESQEIDIFLHVTRLKHADDFVVALGAYPRELPDEGETIHGMIAGIRH